MKSCFSSARHFAQKSLLGSGDLRKGNVGAPTFETSRRTESDFLQDKTNDTASLGSLLMESN